MGLAVLGQDRREQVGGRSRTGGETDLASTEAFDLGHGTPTFFDRSYRGAGMGEQRSTGGGDRGASATAVEEPTPELFFQPLDRGGEGRLGAMGSSRGLGEGAQLGYQQERSQLINHKQYL
jgi:hypothetical protein